MKTVIAAALLAVSCANVNPYAHDEMDSCPPTMSEEQQASGAVRCRALCSSYAREFAEFDHECKCRCAPAAGKGGYRPNAGATQM